jgi:hypothetical protein
MATISVTVSLDLDLLSQILYLQEGEVTPGYEPKAVRFETKMVDWERDVVQQGTKTLMREDILAAMIHLQNGFGGYWCEGEKCGCDRTHWVVYKSKSKCWECMQHPYACNPPLVWDHDEKAYFRFFLSYNSKAKTSRWMTQPCSKMATINYKPGEKKWKERQEKELEEENCAEDQQNAQNHGYCCHQHARIAKDGTRKAQEVVEKTNRKGY